MGNNESVGTYDLSTLGCEDTDGIVDRRIVGMVEVDGITDGTALGASYSYHSQLVNSM